MPEQPDLVDGSRSASSAQHMSYLQQADIILRSQLHDHVFLILNTYHYDAYCCRTGSEDDTVMVLDTSDPGLGDKPQLRSIYQHYSRTRRVLVLVAVCLATMLPPFADMVYVPALPVRVRGSCRDSWFKL
jgi:hypothetical protein